MATMTITVTVITQTLRRSMREKATIITIITIILEPSTQANKKLVIMILQMMTLMLNLIFFHLLLAVDHAAIVTIATITMTMIITIIMILILMELMLNQITR